MSFFNTDGTSNQGDQSNNGVNQNPSETKPNDEGWLDKVVAEKGEQWKDPETLAKGYKSAQDYIANLEKQAQELREDLGKKDYTEELLKQIQAGQAKPSTGEPAGLHKTDNNSGATDKGNTNLGLSEDDVKSLISQTLSTNELNKTREQNLTTANAKLTEVFGTEVEDEVTKRSDGLGMSKERLAEIASESPTAFFKLLGVEDIKEKSNPSVSGTINTSTVSFNQSSDRDFGFYQKLRRENPNRYYSAAVQKQMFEDRVRLGDKF